MGSIITSSLTIRSHVRSTKFRYEQFINRGQSSQGSRCLRCVNNTSECEIHTYSDGSICQSQKLLGDSCNNNTECRMDFNYICLSRQQCGQNTINGLNNPTGLFVNNNESIYVSDINNNRVIKLQQGSLNGTVVTGTGSSGNGTNQLNKSLELVIDASSNIYVSDDSNVRIMLWQKECIRWYCCSSPVCSQKDEVESS